MAILAFSWFGHWLTCLSKEQLGPPVTYARARPSRFPNFVDAHDQAEIFQVLKMASRPRHLGTDKLGFQFLQSGAARVMHELEHPASVFTDLLEQQLEHVSVGCHLQCFAASLCTAFSRVSQEAPTAGAATPDQAHTGRQLVRVDVGVDLVELSRADPAPARPGSALAVHRAASVWRKCREKAAQVQPAPFTLSEFPQLAGSSAVALVTRLGDLPAAATPVAVSVHQVEPGLAGRRWPSLALSSARLPTSTRRAQTSQVFRVRHLEHRS